MDEPLALLWWSLLEFEASAAAAVVAVAVAVVVVMKMKKVDFQTLLIDQKTYTFCLLVYQFGLL